MGSEVPPDRLRTVCEGDAASTGPVVYWCTMARRTHHNAAFQHAANEAARRGVGMWMLEVLRCDYPHASARFHAFIRDGMRDNQVACKALGVGYHAHLETQPGDTKSLLAEVAQQASLIVTDDHPGFFIPRMLAAVNVSCPVVAVDGNGLLPLSLAPKPFSAAVHFRRFLQKTLPDVWWFPDEQAEPDGADVPDAVTKRWPMNVDVDLAALPIDQTVSPVERKGGSVAGADALDAFDVERYLESRHPDAHATSKLSPYLHYGHVGAHQVIGHVLREANFSAGRWNPANGARSGWWGLSEPVESFLDQIVTWRELGFVDCHLNPANNRYDSLPEWARDSLAMHAADARTTYTLSQLEKAATDDPIWNAAQQQLLQDGVIHNYLRMLWGKRILEWSPSPKEALRRMLHLNDKWALDGRDPNSISGITWVLGRFDRAWGERDIYGKVRYMSSDNTRRKLRMTEYLDRYG